MKQKDRSQVDQLPVLPLPELDQDLTRVIPCYQHPMLQGTTNDEIAKNSSWTSVGLSSFEDKFDLKVSRRWIELEEEAYESVNVSPLPPFFRSHVPCLSSRTNNSTRPLCVVRGVY